MKTTQILPLFLISFLLLYVLDSNAQQTREMRPLDNYDFECLQSLECVQNSRSLKEKGWTFIFDETEDEFAQEFRASMKGEHISFLPSMIKKGT